MIPFPLIGKLLLRYWRIGAVLVALALGWLALDSYGDRRAKAEGDRVQALWDADEAEEKRVADAETLKNQLEDAADEARNQQIADTHARNLAAATADNARLARLLRQATAPARPSGASEGPNQPGTAPAGTPGGDEPPAADSGIHQLIADALTEARMNADALDALIDQVRPQM